MLNPCDITVVVQGPNIRNETSKCLKSIRQYLPGATIVFSTYTNEDVVGLDYDVLVRSKDPGATRIRNINSFNMINRILTTSKAGLKKVKTKYCIRMRSDLLFDSNKILYDLNEKFPVRNPKYSVLEKRLVFFSFWSRYSEMDNFTGNRIARPFCLSDWFCFGLTNDVKKYYMDCPLTREPDYTDYFKYQKNYSANTPMVFISWRFPPEQWIGVNFFKRYFPGASMHDSMDFDDEKIRLSAELIANNMIVAGYKELGVFCQKEHYKMVSKGHQVNDTEWLKGVITHPIYQSMYKEYCDNGFVLPKYDERLEYLQTHLGHHVRRLKNIKYYLGDILATLYYLILTIIRRIVVWVK